MYIGLSNKQPVDPLSHPVSQKLASKKRRLIEYAFVHEVYYTASLFRFFDHPTWASFFSTLHHFGTLPSRDILCRLLITDIHRIYLFTMVKAINKPGGITFGIKSAMETFIKSISHDTVHIPITSFFVFGICISKEKID